MKNRLAKELICGVLGVLGFLLFIFSLLPPLLYRVDGGVAFFLGLSDIFISLGFAITWMEKE